LGPPVASEKVSFQQRKHCTKKRSSEVEAEGKGWGGLINEDSSRKQRRKRNTAKRRGSSLH